MSRTRQADRRHALGHATCAVQLLAGAGLLTLMPSVMAESPFTQALEYAQPLSWVMLAAGLGVLLGQRWLGGKRAPAVGIADVVRSETRPDGAAAVAACSRPNRIDAGVLRRIPERRFEAVVEALFAGSGCRAGARSRLAEGGVDLWLQAPGTSSATSVVRCRQRAGRTVSIDEIRQLERAMTAQGVREGHFATTSLLTPDAIAFARSRGIRMHDVDGIVRMASRLATAEFQALLAAATEDDLPARHDRAAQAAGPELEPTQAAMPDAAPAARATVVQLPERFRASRAAA